MRGVVLFLLATATCAAQSLPDFAGTWIQKWDGRIFLVLTLKVGGANLAGSVVHPQTFSMDQEGDLSKISAAHATFPLQKLALAGQRLEFTFDGERYGMTLVDRDHTLLRPLDEDYPLPPWKLERSTDPHAQVATSWPAPRYPAEIVALQKRLTSMMNVDQKVRLAGKVSVTEMENIDRSHPARSGASGQQRRSIEKRFRVSV